MTDQELISRIYDRCPDMLNNDYTYDQLFDRCQDIRDMIKREQPTNNKHHPQRDVGIDY